MTAAAQRETDERREHPRALLKTTVSYNFNSDSNFYTGFSNDIGEGGLFVATYNVQPIGSVFDLEFSLPDNSAPVRVKAEVRWVKEYNPSSDGHPGMGLRFTDLSPADRARIEAFVRARDPLFFEDE